MQKDANIEIFSSHVTYLNFHNHQSELVRDYWCAQKIACPIILEERLKKNANIFHATCILNKVVEN